MRQEFQQPFNKEALSTGFPENDMDCTILNVQNQKNVSEGHRLEKMVKNHCQKSCIEFF